MPMPSAYLQRIGTATPRHDVHAAFVDYARQLLETERERLLFDRMVERSGIAHRYSVLQPGQPSAGEVDAGGFYRPGAFPGTAERMAVYGPEAFDLALRAVHALAPPDELAARLARVSHVVLASCTGFAAPGLDIQLIDALGLNPQVQRTVVGFMGCSAALPALRVAQLAVRGDPEALALVLNVELCSLHLHESHSLEQLLSFLLFADGAAAALVGAEAVGAELLDFRSELFSTGRGLITWDIGNRGFLMHLSGQVPVRIAESLCAAAVGIDAAGLLRGRSVQDYALWAVHAGGRTVLDAVERGLGLNDAALADSRAVLRAAGNMSSATVMFVLQRMLARAAPDEQGLALALGPGLSMESMHFRMAGLS